MDAWKFIRPQRQKKEGRRSSRQIKRETGSEQWDDNINVITYHLISGSSWFSVRAVCTAENLLEYLRDMKLVNNTRPS